MRTLLYNRINLKPLTPSRWGHSSRVWVVQNKNSGSCSENRGVLVRCVFTFHFILLTLMSRGSCPHFPATQSWLKHLLTGMEHDDRAWQQDPGCSTSQSANHDQRHAMINTRRTELGPAIMTGPCSPVFCVWLSVAKAGSSCGTCRGQRHDTTFTKRQTCTITELEEGKYTDQFPPNASESPTILMCTHYYPCMQKPNKLLCSTSIVAGTI